MALDLAHWELWPEGRSETPLTGLSFFKASGPSFFRKVQTWAVNLSWVIQGRKLARIGGQEFLYEPGKALVVTGPATYEAQVVEASPSAPYLAFVLRLSAPLLVRTLWGLADHGFPAVGRPQPAFVVDVAPPLDNALERLVQALADPVDVQMVAPLIQEEVAVRLLRTEAASTLRHAVRRDGDFHRIVQAMELIRQQLAQPLRVADLAQAVGMSASHFAHRFRAWTQTSPIQYQKQLRLETARNLMLEKGLRVGEAAREVGYSNPSTFTREFRGFFQASPGELVRRLSESQSGHKLPQKPTLVVEAPFFTF